MRRGRGAPARGSWTRRAAATTGAALISTFVLVGSPADAQPCVLRGLAHCGPRPAPGRPEPSPSPSTTTTMPPRSTKPKPDPEKKPKPAPKEQRSPAAPDPGQARADLLSLVNGERARRGLATFSERADVTEIAGGWSVSMARAGAISHNDAYFSSDTRRRLDASVLGENVARATDIDSAHRALMASAPHRANILDARFVTIGIGAVFSDGSWWITEDFLQPRSASPARPATSSPPRPSMRHDAARVLTAIAPVGPSHVLAASTSSPAEQPQRPDGRPELPKTLASEWTIDPWMTKTVVAAAVLLCLSVLALRRVLRSEETEAAVVEHPPTPVPDAVATLDATADVDLAASDDVSDPDRCLTIILAWIRTLDDRWPALSESDKRVAVQIIRRNAETAAGSPVERVAVSA